MSTAETRIVDWPPPPRRPKRRIGLWLVLGALAAIVFGGSTTVSYYVDALWYNSLGYGDVFWKTLNIQGVVFSVFFAITFLVIYGSYLLFKPARPGELAGGG